MARKFKTERELVSDTMRRLRMIPESWWYKIPDPSRCLACGNIGLASIRPFDIIGVHKGNAIAIEAKRSRNIPLEKHQLAQLCLVAMAGGVAVKMEGSASFIEVDPYLKEVSNEIATSLEDLVKFARL